ncbi:MAG: NAD(P)H-binding protein, partial [Spirochaetales bacterium]|nr:NAD(P)H-binding protein [Spirochaetales bacterium]
MENNRKQIIVYGGTGFYGHKVVEKLVKKGQSVKVVTRNSVNAVKLLGDKVELFQGDITEKGTIARSLENAGAIVICLSAMSNKLIRKMKEIERDAVLEIMEEAKRANISRLVYMSGYEMREQVLTDLKIPEFGKIKIEIEERIKQSDFNWTILGDAPAFEIFFAFINKG